MISNNKKSYFIFAFCLLFSLKTFAAGKIVQRVEELMRRAAKSSNPRIDKKFNDIMDDVLEITGMNRADIPEHILNNLRNATMDPLRLIDPDSHYRVNTSMFFRGGHDKDITHLHRAFLQKSSIDSTNKKQMDRLAVIVDRTVNSYDIPAHLETLSREDVLQGLFIHRGVTTDSGFPTPEFQDWLDDLYRALYEKESFEEAAKKAFEGGRFDEETFFELWKNEDFRRFIAESRFMTKAHLTGNWELLIRWSSKLNFGIDRQFSGFIASSYREAHKTYDVDGVLEKDEFWQTVVRASNESDGFGRRVQEIIRRITPVQRDREIPIRGARPYGGGPAS